ncbi:hypothetical protein FOTG_15060 [Fusarium oxysporum f. sp. vasinfectum 25433]|uniref:Zn(2)-C6 fungal-type domain-containing protein n=1 Tax=Fusarium oxysporum f. sp. vasinfectum 25433 TaxID=1089449 RepID=X0KSN3_FUSOX|nr:hypothetical protein FOTG_15060 [Fusarium oxysporum f. sp. vasinfectum 25433]
MASPDQLAQGSCFNCRRQKQRCDRLLPRCSRCASKRITCDYKATPSSQPSIFSPGTQVEPVELVHLRDSCRFDLSPLAERYLVWAACASDSDRDDESSHSQPTLSSLIQDIFTAGGVDLRTTIETYFSIAHNWLPILDKEQLYFDTSHLLRRPDYQNDVLALLLLCIYIFIQPPCQHPNHSVKTALYRTARRLFFLLQLSSHGSDIGLLQSGLLLVTYGLGHGLSKDAYGTLSVCTSLAQQLSPGVSKMDNCRQDNGPRPEITKLDLCWSGIILLDNTITLSHFEPRIPQFVGLNRRFVGLSIGEAEEEDLYGDDLSRKFLARAQVALRIGKILDAVGKSFPLCETVAMALSALAILYSLQNPQISAHSSPETRSAVQCVHNMIFDTFHTEGEILRSRGWSNTSRPCFLGICCLQGAAIRVDRLYVDGLTSEHLEELRCTLEAFSTRWKLGESFTQALNNRRDSVE